MLNIYDLAQGVRIIVVEVDWFLACTLNLHLFLDILLRNLPRNIFIDGKRENVDARRAIYIEVEYQILQ